MLDEQDGKRDRRRQLALIVVVVILLIAVADWWQRNAEMNALLRAVEQSEAAMEHGSDAIKSSYAYYDSSQRYSQQEIMTLRAAVEAAAREAMVDVQVSGAGVDEVFVLPWHRRIKLAKRRYANHSAAWEGYLRRTAEDADVLGDRAASADIASTFRIAERAFERAIPFFPRFNISARVAAVFAE